MDALAKPGMQEAIKEQAEQKRASLELFYMFAHSFEFDQSDERRSLP